MNERFPVCATAKYLCTAGEGGPTNRGRFACIVRRFFLCGLLLGGLSAQSVRADQSDSEAAAPDGEAGRSVQSTQSTQLRPSSPGRARIERLSSAGSQSQPSGRVKLSNLSAAETTTPVAGRIRLETLTPVPIDVTDPVELLKPVPIPQHEAVADQTTNSQVPASIAPSLEPLPLDPPVQESKTAASVPLPGVAAPRVPEFVVDSEIERKQSPELRFDPKDVVHNAVGQAAPHQPVQRDAQQARLGERAPIVLPEPDAVPSDREPARPKAEIVAREAASNQPEAAATDQDISDGDVLRFNRFITLLARHSQTGSDVAIPPAPAADAEPAAGAAQKVAIFPPIGRLTTNIRVKPIDRTAEDGVPGVDEEPIPDVPEDLAAEWFRAQEPIRHGISDVTMWLRATSDNYQQDFYHRPLYFEDANAERCGYTYGFYQPLVSAAHFFGSVALLPYKLADQPPNKYVYATPNCPPGTAYTPLDNFLPPPYSLRGALAQAGVVTGLVFIIP
jgi:hypothetical protein